jgi:hypothetical protein
MYGSSSPTNSPAQAVAAQNPPKGLSPRGSRRAESLKLSEPLDLPIYEKDNLFARADYHAESDFTTSLIPHSVRIFSDSRCSYQYDGADFSENPFLSLKKVAIHHLQPTDPAAQPIIDVECETLKTNQKVHFRITAEDNDLSSLVEVIKSVATEEYKHDQIEPSSLPKNIASSEKGAILFSEGNIMFSALRQRSYMFSMVWKNWTHRTIRIYANGQLTYTHPYNKTEAPSHHTLKLETVDVQCMTEKTIEHDDQGNEKSHYKYGLNVKCQTLEDVDTYFRCIFEDEHHLDHFFRAIRLVAKSHNLEKLTKSEIHRLAVTADGRNSDQLTNISGTSNSPSLKAEDRRSIFKSLPKSSVMRRTTFIDAYQHKNQVEAIRAKRGALKWLPVIGSNDLVHGSW